MIQAMSVKKKTKRPLLGVPRIPATRRPICFFWKPAMIGFSLIELMVTIAVLAIVLSIAAPSFQAFVRNNRMTSVANELVSALNLARSEAVRRGKTVTVCQSDANAATPSCNGTSWTDGWLVFVGTAGAGDDDSANHIKVGQINLDGVQIDAPADEMGFSASGASTSSGTFTISTVCESGDGNKKREVEIGTTGRISVSSPPC
jgi:type IV fimbrial biogenesis protein FimT